MSYPLLESFNSTAKIAEIVSNYPLVAEMQSLLFRGGFYAGKVDGFWGEKTAAAFITFKKVAYLEYPDYLGKGTATALLELAGKAIHPIPKDGWYGSDGSRELKLPGTRVVKIGDLIPGSNSFTWGEATALGSRKPENSQVVTSIIKLAQYLDRVKALFGNRPLHINSWYRPESVNRAVGGVSNSIHLLGSAVDFTIEGINPLEAYRSLDGWHGRVGGLGRYRSFTHIDLRGYPARWDYGA